MQNWKEIQARLREIRQNRRQRIPQEGERPRTPGTRDEMIAHLEKHWDRLKSFWATHPEIADRTHDGFGFQKFDIFEDWKNWFIEQHPTNEVMGEGQPPRPPRPTRPNVGYSRPSPTTPTYNRPGGTVPPPNTSIYNQPLPGTVPSPTTPVHQIPTMPPSDISGISLLANLGYQANIKQPISGFDIRRPNLNNKPLPTNTANLIAQGGVNTVWDNEYFKKLR